jgi:hypothetical protein
LDEQIYDLLIISCSTAGTEKSCALKKGVKHGNKSFNNRKFLYKKD